MENIIFGSSPNGKGDKLIGYAIGKIPDRVKVNVYEVKPEYEIGEIVPNDYDIKCMNPVLTLTFCNKKSLKTTISALKQTLEAWNNAEDEAEIRNMMMLREKIENEIKFKF